MVYFSDTSIKGDKDFGFGQAVKWDTPVMEGYSSSFVKNWRRGRSMNNKFWDVFNPGVIRILWKSKEKIVLVNGWVYSSHLMAIIFAKLIGKQVWMRGDNPLNQELKKSKRLRLLKKCVMTPFFYLFIDKFLFVGNQNKLFYKYYGVTDEKLIFAPHAVDNEYFKEKANDFKNKKDALKTELLMPLEKKIILVCGKYIAKKRPLDLLKAFSLLPKDQYTLVFVGEGELRGKMEQYISSNKLNDVLLTGFINQSQISKYYAAADVFVMCSGMGETWGLAVNEAMNFGLPVIVSETCGCSYDLVQNGKNGFVVEEGDVSALSVKLLLILENEDLAHTMGIESKKLVDHYSIPTIVVNIKNAL